MRQQTVRAGSAGRRWRLLPLLIVSVLLLRSCRRCLERNRERQAETAADSGWRFPPVGQRRDGRVDRPDAIVPVEQRRELLSVLSSQAEDYPGLSPGFLERISHVAGH